MQTEATRQRVVFEWGQTLFTELRRVWAQLETEEALAYEDKVAAQVHVLEEATASLGQLYHTLGRSCRRLRRHLQSLPSWPSVRHEHVRVYATSEQKWFIPNRLPIEIIGHGVWLYFRFCLSYRDVEEIVFHRRLLVSYEAIRKWCRKYGQPYANQLRRQRLQPGDTWHLDEAFQTIKGERYDLWRAADQDGQVVGILVQRRRTKAVAMKFFRTLLEGLRYVPRVIVTDTLVSDGAAKREVWLGVERHQHRYLDNRAKNPSQPTRQRGWRMQRFKSPGHAQRVLAAYDPIAQLFRPRHQRFSASAYRQEMRRRFDLWQELTTLPTAA
jgi:putative transposase